ncbi:MAG: hypothetical protein ACLP9L_04220 [Thermoguttaceae bacterium]
MISKTRLLCAIIGFVCSGSNLAAQEQSVPTKPPLLFTGVSLPTPPAQGHPWQLSPGTSSEKWVSAVEELYQYGFADPRGCEYREVKLICAGQPVTTHAWSIPAGTEEREGMRRFAVTWDGQVYPVLEIGPAADFKKDVEAILTNFAKESPPDERVSIFGGARMRTRVSYEEDCISFKSPLALKTCLLCRLGEIALAERVWTAWAKKARADNARDPYLIFVEEWGWALYKRAASAHNLGDDVISLACAKTLMSMQEAVERIAPRRGLPRPTDYESPPRELPYLNFGDSPALLYEDASRRVQAKPVKRVLDVGLQRFPGQDQRIKALVRDLEIVDADWPPFAYFCSRDVLVANSPIVKALVQEGPPAVFPLLECLASDRRLTRAVVYHGKFEPIGCYLLGVDEAAFAALRGILGVDTFGPKTVNGYFRDEGDLKERRAVSDEIRSFWQKQNGKTRDDVWLAVLADREATADQWLEVANKIVEPIPPVAANQPTQPKAEVPFGYEPQGGSRLVMGEALRNRNNPRVAELMTQRANDIVAGRGLRSEADVDEQLRSACDLTVCLAKWDRWAAVPAIRRRFADYRDYPRREDRMNTTFASYVTQSLTLLAEAGVQVGDEGIINDYVAWVRAIPAEDIQETRLSVFLPLWRHPENPKLAELARWAFGSEESPWHPNRAEGRGWEGWWVSPLLRVPEFRKLLKRTLADVTPIGTVTVKHNALNIEIAAIPGKTGASISGGYRSPYAQDSKPTEPNSWPLRACDQCAHSISELAGSPRFELDWPERKRAKALADLAVFLDRWGHCFHELDTRLDTDCLIFCRPRFYLPKLIRPATPEDVAAGRAIFSLRDRSDVQVRVVEFKPHPGIARWKTLRQFPLREPGYMESPKEVDSQGILIWDHVPRELYDREGYIWQAEEVLVDGKWHRFYGFVGTHIIAKVPAEEIQILDDFCPSHPQSL